MKKMKNLFEILRTGAVLGKYLTGSESANEKKEIDNWLGQDNNNRNLFKSLKDDKQLADSIIEFDKFDKEAAWKKYAESISKQSKKATYFWWRIAASFLVIVTLSAIVLSDYKSEKRQHTDKFTQAILPGQPKAFIEFDNGTRIDLQYLTEKQEDKLAKDVGIVVVDNTVVNSAKNTIEKQAELLTVLTPRGGEYKVVLDDGTQIWLNADSRLEFPNKFLGDNRRVRLSGEAYFIVAKDERRPFTVSLDNMDVEVLGTEFNISAYGDDNLTQTTLIEGKVSVRNNQDISSSNKQNILIPGEQASFNKNDKTIEVRSVNVNQFIAWREGRFFFDNQTLGEIVAILERWYDVDFVFTNDELKNLTFSGEFLRYGDIGKVYEIIKKTGTKIKFTKVGRTIELSS